MSRAEDLFHQAMSLPPEERKYFLEEACGADSVLHEDVLQLLRHAEEAPASFLEGRAVELESFGPYAVEERIGHGGQGSVYRATDTRLGRKVALKILNPAMALSEAALARFQREAETTARLDHPGICTIYETGQVDGAPYLAMQYLEGRTLQDLIAATRKDPEWDRPSVRLPGADGSTLPASSSSRPTHARRSPGMRVVHLIEQVARALDAAHRAGVVHRDVKPGNIMVMPDDRPVVLDFGLARDLQGEGATLTRAGDVFGTPHYMSPEQITRSAHRLDRRTDIYSLGCVLYECLTLTLPFEAETVDGLYQAILTKEPRNPRRIHPAIPVDVRIILETAMDKDRDRRYATAADFADDLKAVLDLRPIRAKPISPLGRAVRWVQREPMKAALLLVLAVGLPVLTWLGGNVAAHRWAIDIGREAERRRLEHHHYDQAMIVASANDYEGARPHFRKCLDLNPRSVRGLMGLWWTETDRAKGLALLETYRDELGGDPAYDALLGAALWSADRKAEAGVLLRQPHWLGHFMAGGRAWLMGAMLQREDLLARGGSLLTLSSLMAPGSVLGGLMKIQECQVGTRDPQAALTDRVIADLYPHEPQAFGYRAKCAAWQGDMATARALRNEAARLIGEGDDFRRAYLWRVDAVLAVAEGRFDDAVAVGREAFKARPVSYTGITLAWAYLGAGRFQEARAVLGEVVSIGEGGFEAVPLLALCCVREGNTEEALRVLAGAAEKAALADEPLAYRAQLLLDDGRAEEAESDLTAALARWPDRTWSKYLRAQLLLAKGDEAGARRAFAEAEAADPGFATRRVYDEGLVHEGIRCALRLGVRLFPADAARQDALARFFLDPRTVQHDVAAALEPARNAAELDGRYRLTLAETLFRNGETAEAIALAEAVLAGEGETSAAAEALGRFRAAR